MLNKAEIITKQHKIRAIADIRRGKVTPKLAPVMKCFIPVLCEDEATINGTQYDRATFEEIRNYLNDVLKVKHIIILSRGQIDELIEKL